jgi:hypothetical protein
LILIERVAINLLKGGTERESWNADPLFYLMLLVLAIETDGIYIKAGKISQRSYCVVTFTV